MHNWKENIFKPIRNENLHQDSNDNGVRVVNFAAPKNLVVKSIMFSHRNIYNAPGPLVMERLTTRLFTYR
jgi:hypothetical protein